MNGEKRKLAFVKGMKNEGKNMSKSISILDKDYCVTYRGDAILYKQRKASNFAIVMIGKDGCRNV